MTASYSHRDYSAPFDRGTIFDLNTGHAVNVDRKTRFDEAFNNTDGYSDLAQLNAGIALTTLDRALRLQLQRDHYNDNPGAGDSL